MFPSLRHRVLIAVSVVLGALIWLWARGVLQAADGGSGYTIVGAQAGPIVATVVVALLGVPVVALGLFVSTTGHPLSGIFTVAAALAILAGTGGSIDGWLIRHVEADALPAAYTGLIGEVLLWQIGVVIMLTVIARLRSPLRTRYPALAYDDHLGVDVHIRLPQMQAVVAGVASAVIAGFFAYHLIRSTDAGQVMWSLILAFTAGGCLAHLTFPHSNPVGILLSPALVAIAAYTWIMLGTPFHSSDGVLELAFNLRYRVPLPAGLAFALPIHYVAAGTVGTTLGIGLAHAFEASKTPAAPENPAPETSA